MKKLLASLALALPIVACTSINTQVVTPLLTDLAKINATAVADLVVFEKTAQAATPPDTDGYNCAAAAITVSGQVAAVVAASNQAGAGVLTAAELASLFQPGSAQANLVQGELVSGCAAKAQDVLGAAGVLAAGGVLGALAINAGGILPLAAAM